MGLLELFPDENCQNNIHYFDTIKSFFKLVTIVK